MTVRALSSAERALLVMVGRRPDGVRPTKIDQRLVQRLWDDDLIEVDWAADRIEITREGRYALAWAAASTKGD